MWTLLEHDSNGGIVEEVQDISTQFGASLNHIPQEANDMADGLAWKEFFS